MKTINQSISVARNISYKVLYDIYYNNAYSNLSIKKHFKALKKEEDKALATNIIFGTIKNDIYLTDIIKKLSSVEYDKIKPEISVLLKAGIYQLYYMDRVPAYAVVNDCVNIAKFYVSNKSGAFVNAVLRNAGRQKSVINLDKDDISLMPLWLTDYMSEFYDKKFLNQWIEDFKKNPQMFVRVNQLKSTSQEAFLSLNKDKLSCKKTFLPDVFKVLDSDATLNSSLFLNSVITVQDISAALCAYALDTKKEEKVLDLCAAPGGKSLHIASLTEDQAFLTACDIHQHKIDYMKNVFKYNDVKNIQVKKNNAENHTKEFDNRFDKVIVDAPCSGLGVIKRKPEILLRLTKRDIENIIKIQSKILNNAAKYVKNKGILLYCTCSINPKENELQIEKFLSQNHDFSLCDIKLPNTFYEHLNILQKGEIKLFSHAFDGDGFYICKMRKN
jgi:16S rRNA (cytosine967-C5)-methyltransferase